MSNIFCTFVSLFIYLIYICLYLQLYSQNIQKRIRIIKKLQNLSKVLTHLTEFVSHDRKHNF